MASSGGSWSPFRPKGSESTYNIHVKSGESKRDAIKRYRKNGYEI